MLRFLTSGESHGRALLAILDGMPAGVPIDCQRVNQELRRRQQGYGRGARQKIENDQLELIGGVRHGITSGAPLGLFIANRDWGNWQHVMSAAAVDLCSDEVIAQLEKKAIKRFRPGHADLAGTLKFRQRDIRDVLERASARETAVRVAVGAVCQELLAQFNIQVIGHVVQVGQVKAPSAYDHTSLSDLDAKILQSELFCADPAATDQMRELVKAAWQEGDSLGGVVEVLADGLPVGLGSYTQWDERLDGQLAQAVISIQAFKAVEVGDGVESAGQVGSSVHDPLYPSSQEDVGLAGRLDLPFMRKSNRAGGLEGGMTNGERLKLRAYMKPLPTLRKALPSVSFPDFQADTAHFERSDVCAIAAASVVCKAMVAFVLARAMINKFGGDTLADMRQAVGEYLSHCQARGHAGQGVPGQGVGPTSGRSEANPEAESE